MDVRKIMAVATLVAAGLAVQGLILAEVVARPLAGAVAAAQRAEQAPGATDGTAPAREAAPGRGIPDGGEPVADGKGEAGAGTPDAVTAAERPPEESADAGGSGARAAPIAAAER